MSGRGVTPQWSGRCSSGVGESWSRWDCYIRKTGRHFFLNLSDMNLSDGDLGLALQRFRSKITHSDVFDIDLSMNPISDAGVIDYVVPFLADLPWCHRLKLFQTCIGDRALRALCSWIGLGYVRELHLSDLGGGVTGAVVFELLREVCLGGWYPFRNGWGPEYSALWLRLENNNISDTVALVSRCVAMDMNLVVLDEACMIRERPFGVGKKGPWSQTPAVRLVYFYSQGVSSHDVLSSHSRFGIVQRSWDYVRCWRGDGWRSGEAVSMRWDFKNAWRDVYRDVQRGTFGGSMSGWRDGAPWGDSEDSHWDVEQCTPQDMHRGSSWHVWKPAGVEREGRVRDCDETVRNLPAVLSEPVGGIVGMNACASMTDLNGSAVIARSDAPDDVVPMGCDFKNAPRDLYQGVQQGACGKSTSASSYDEPWGVGDARWCDSVDAQRDVEQCTQPNTQRGSSWHVSESSAVGRESTRIGREGGVVECDDTVGDLSDDTNPWLTMTDLNSCSVSIARSGAWCWSSVVASAGVHVPCLLKEAVGAMFPVEMRLPDGKYNGTYVDCTFGRGGHSREILSRLSSSGRLFAFDVDPEAVAVAKDLERQDTRFRIIHRPFGDFGDVFEAGGFGRGCVRGVLLDLGVSSPQLDYRHRGFNVYGDVPLDMRMNPNVGVPAWQWLMEVTVEGLAWVIHAYGEDDDYLLSERIASALVESRPTWGRMLTCRHAAEIVSGIVCSGGYIRHMNPARLTFQSIRVYLNQEMQQLDSVLNGAFRALEVGGHCSVISFKRKESGAVLGFVRRHEEPPDSMLGLPQRELCEMWPLLKTDVLYTVEHVGEPITPAPTEVQNNNRCRSSKVHPLRKGLRVSSCLSRDVLQQLELRPVGDRMVSPVPPVFRGA